MLRLAGPALVLALVMMAGAAVADPDLGAWANEWVAWSAQTADTVGGEALQASEGAGPVAAAAGQWADGLSTAASAAASRFLAQGQETAAGCLEPQVVATDELVRAYAGAGFGDASRELPAACAAALAATQAQLGDAPGSAPERINEAMGVALDLQNQVIGSIPPAPEAPALDPEALSQPPAIPSIPEVQSPAIPEAPEVPAIEPPAALFTFADQMSGIALQVAYAIANAAPGIPSEPPAAPAGIEQAIGPLTVYADWTLPAL